MTWSPRARWRGGWRAARGARPVVQDRHAHADVGREEDPVAGRQAAPAAQPGGLPQVSGGADPDSAAGIGRRDGRPVRHRQPRGLPRAPAQSVVQGPIGPGRAGPRPPGRTHARGAGCRRRGYRQGRQRPRARRRGAHRPTRRCASAIETGTSEVAGELLQSVRGPSCTITPPSCTALTCCFPSRSTCLGATGRRATDRRVGGGSGRSGRWTPRMGLGREQPSGEGVALRPGAVQPSPAR